MCEKADQSAAALSRQLLIARLESALVEIPDAIELVEMDEDTVVIQPLLRSRIEIESAIRKLRSQGEFREKTI